MRWLFPLFLILVLASCAKPECEKTSDCEQRKCFTAKCSDDKCSYAVVKGCCGNLLCEEDEGENVCSCKQDCSKEKCEGYVVLETSKAGNEVYAKYLNSFCSGGRCITGINPSDVREIPLIDERQVRSFKLSSVVKVNKPFDITKDQIRIEIQVKDLGSDMAMPLRFTGIKIISGDLLFGSKKIMREISSSGETFTESVSLTYVPQKPEEERSVGIRIDYEYDQIMDKANNTRRISDTYQHSLADKIFLVNPVEG